MAKIKTPRAGTKNAATAADPESPLDEGLLSVNDPSVEGERISTSDLHNDYEVTVALPLDLSTREICEQLQSVYDDSSRSPSGFFEVKENAGGIARLTFGRDIFDDLGCTGNEDALSVTREWCLKQILREFQPVEGDGEAVQAFGRALRDGEAVCSLYRLDGTLI